MACVSGEVPRFMASRPAWGSTGARDGDAGPGIGAVGRLGQPLREAARKILRIWQTPVPPGATEVASVLPREMTPTLLVIELATAGRRRRSMTHAALMNAALFFFLLFLLLFLPHFTLNL